MRRFFFSETSSPQWEKHIQYKTYDTQINGQIRQIHDAVSWTKDDEIRHFAEKQSFNCITYRSPQTMLRRIAIVRLGAVLSSCNIR